MPTPSRLDAEHPRPDEAVQVLPRPEGLDQARVPGQVRHDPHLDLAVVRGHERLEPVPDDEGLTDPPPLLGADRDVLQVGVGRTQPTSRGNGLQVGRVDPSVVIDTLDQPLDRDPQLGRITMAQQRSLSASASVV